MDRRLFLALTASGLCASTSGAQPVPPADPALGPLGVPAGIANSGDPEFDTWMAGFYARATGAGWSPALLQRELAGLALDPKIAALDSKQPEFSKPVGEYVQGAVTQDRITTGRIKLAEIPLLPKIEATYGVPAGILIGVWAMESAFGAIQGRNDVIRSLATLAAQGRRRAWAETQIYAALRIISTNQATRAQLKGSWAGAMGQTQFIPTAYLDTAVDADGDGKRDIWGSSVDALASAANLLNKAGWRRGEGWAREVILPAAFDFSLSEGPRQTPPGWAALGAAPADDAPWSSADLEAPAQLILPAGAIGPAFLVFANHFAIREYNNSIAYALAVGLLADRIYGRPPLATPWPTETPLSLADRISAQQALARMGFDPGDMDGVVGLHTRAALRGWQKAKGLPADGYLTADMVRRLTTAR